MTKQNRELQGIQNFCDNFNITASVFTYEDLRKKPKYVISKEGISLSPPLSYEEANIFLLGVLRATENNLKKVKP
jgi:transcription termination factor NusB